MVRGKQVMNRFGGTVAERLQFGWSPFGSPYCVSCRPADGCTAVGGHDIVHGEVPLSEAWTGV
jgi:hypothetical protein